MLEQIFTFNAALAIPVLALLIIYLLLRSYISRPALRKLPGPKFYALSRYRLAVDAWHCRSVHKVQQIHREYGPVVRIGPNEVSFNSLTALKTIYGAGSAFERTSFYHMFDVYKTPNLFSFSSGKDHRERKKLISHLYSNQSILGPYFSDLVQRKVSGFLEMLEREPSQASEIFFNLHWFSFDTISEFVYGARYGGTQALQGSKESRNLILDILNPARRRLSWFLVHFPTYAKWITTRTGLLERIVTEMGLMPMKKPFLYTGIRQHSLDAFHSFKAAPPHDKIKHTETTLIGRLFALQSDHNLSDMDIASECADHLLAGIDTTSDSLMFLIWALSLPKNQIYQIKLREELFSVPVNSQGLLEPKELTQLPYLNAILRESLRMYAPLPSFEPRSSPFDAIIDGYHIPARTVVGMSPYCLHREEDIFPDALTFKPERWLNSHGSLLPESDSKNRYFWPFSSGARMCIGMHLANAEMVTLIAAIYRIYSTTARHPNTTPAITARYEIFKDECMTEMAEHQCWISFEKLSGKERVPLADQALDGTTRE